MKLVFLTIMAIVAVLYAQTQCVCDLGVYLKEVNGKCSGEVKHFDTPDLGLGCLVVLQDLGDSVQIEACKQTGLNITAFSDDKCTKMLFNEFLPAGGCKEITADNHTFALGTSCGETN